jgi:hypothetical protein
VRIRRHFNLERLEAACTITPLRHQLVRQQPFAQTVGERDDGGQREQRVRRTAAVETLMGGGVERALASGRTAGRGQVQALP